MFAVFYKAKGNYFDKMIRMWTRGPYSHVEFMFSDGAWFGSSPREGGCRYSNIALDTSKWDFVKIDVTEEQEKVIRAWCNNQNGKGYDWTGIFLSQIFTFNVDDPKKWFCSELCTAGLKLIGRFEKVVPESVHPNKLYKMLNP